MKRRREISVARALGIFALGWIAGLQATSWLWDTFDDGDSTLLSGLIALAFMAIGVGFVLWTFRAGAGE